MRSGQSAAKKFVKRCKSQTVIAVRLVVSFLVCSARCLALSERRRWLLAELAALDQQKPSAAGPTDAVKLLQQLSNLEEQARHHQGDLNEAERRAREEAEKEKQESEWNSRVQAAKQELPTQRTALAEKEAQLPDLLKLAEEVEVQLTDVDKKEKKERKDLLAKQQRTSDDLTKLKADIKRLQAEVADLKERAEESFVFKPSVKPAMRQSQGAGRFVPEAPQSRAASEIPDEALPEVGQLRRHKGQRYLVIDNWAELDDGEQAALRLTARLVAPENA
jgi:chromosome segregation ATPase